MLKKFAPALVLLSTSSFMHPDDNRLETASTEAAKSCDDPSPCVNQSAEKRSDVYLIGQLLVWRASEGGLSLGLKNRNNPPANFNITDAKVKNLTGQWDVGFRVGLGYIFEHDGWDLSLVWMHFNPGSKERTLQANGQRNALIYPSLAASTDPLADNSGCFFGKGHWKVEVNQLDLDLGRDFYVSKRLRVRPHMGVRADWIQQKVKAYYAGFLKVQPSQIDVHFKDSAWGVGLEGGLDSQWNLCCGLSLFGDLGLGVVYGNHRLRFKDVDSPIFIDSSNSGMAGPNGVFAHVKSNSNDLAHPILDMQLGLRWDWTSSSERYHLGLQLGWESHVYFSQNQLPMFGDDFNFGRFYTNQGNLSLQGVTIGARFDF